MVGNNLYKNGGYTYVSPVLLNTPKEQLTLLGLHGYYLVTKVSSEVTENSFTTSIRALQEGIEFRGKEAPSTTVPEKEAEPSKATHDEKAADQAIKEMEAQQSLPVTSESDQSTPVRDETDIALEEAQNQQSLPGGGSGGAPQNDTSQAQAYLERTRAERQSAYDRGENPYPSRGRRGRQFYERQQAARNRADLARAEGGSITLQGYDANTDRQDDPDLAQQATAANEGN